MSSCSFFRHIKICQTQTLNMSCFWNASHFDPLNCIVRGRRVVGIEKRHSMHQSRRHFHARNSYIVHSKHNELENTKLHAVPNASYSTFSSSTRIRKIKLQSKWVWTAKIMYSSSWNTLIDRLQLKCDSTRWRTGGKVKGKLANWVGSLFTLPRNMVYPALLLLMCTPRLSVVDWTDAPAGLNGWYRQPTRCSKIGFIDSFKLALRVSGDSFTHLQEHFYCIYGFLEQCTDPAVCCRPVTQIGSNLCHFTSNARSHKRQDLNGLVPFAERRNLVSARVPSHFNCPLPFRTVRRDREYADNTGRQCTRKRGVVK